MSAIVLATINAKFIHAAFGLRYLAANMGALADDTRVLEFTLDQRPVAIAERILAESPSVVGLGVYIWNAEPTARLVELLRRLAPELTLVVGGPEVSHEIDAQPWLGEVDYIITGEADRAFAELCARIREGRRPLQRVIDGGLPDLDALALPYSLYSDDDLRHRMLYVEASRGCPYRCEFCLSSLDKRVRAFDLPRLLAAFDTLLARGARRFKFVDRTFNLDLRRSAAILRFFSERLTTHPDLFLHFELVPDRLPAELREPIAAFPPGTLQFEIGVQTLDPEVGARIQRRQNLDRTFDNLRFLRRETGVHLHVDLIIGLPGESIEGFAAGLDRLLAAGVQEVQVGVLKRLRGTPIQRHTEPFGLVFDPRPPYAILRSDALDFPTMRRLQRFALVWDVFWNRGRFTGAMRRLWSEGSPFWRTLAFSDWLFARVGRVHAISLSNRARHLAHYLVEVGGLERAEVEAVLEADFARGSKPKSVPRLWADDRGRSPSQSGTPTRQARHLELG